MLTAVNLTNTNSTSEGHCRSEVQGPRCKSTKRLQYIPQTDVNIWRNFLKLEKINWTKKRPLLERFRRRASRGAIAEESHWRSAFSLRFLVMSNWNCSCRQWNPEWYYGQLCSSRRARYVGQTENICTRLPLVAILRHSNWDPDGSTPGAPSCLPFSSRRRCKRDALHVGVDVVRCRRNGLATPLSLPILCPATSNLCSIAISVAVCRNLIAKQ